MTSRLNIKVTPKASHNRIQGWMGETLKISVTTVPEKGKANQAVIKLLSKNLKHPASQIHITAGQQHSNKTVCFDNLDDRELHDRIATVLK